MTAKKRPAKKGKSAKRATPTAPIKGKGETVVQLPPLLVLADTIGELCVQTRLLTQKLEKLRSFVKTYIRSRKTRG